MNVVHEGMDIKDVAESVLFSRSLEEKLSSPTSVTDHQKELLVSLPDLPGRPSELIISEKGVKVEFPGTNKIEDKHERGKMLHFLANHELLATELMALVLLKFPNAPEEFRQGVYKTMREEQAHTRMYMRRMKVCDIEFGQLPVNDYFWRMVAPMECPLDFVSRLSLVFEQANLDYSLHYAKLFRQAGDTGTAAVLEKIYHDEIDHVGHGLKWFRKWKDEGLTDWSAFKKQLHFPLTTARAKGMAPYNSYGRKLAGIDEEWIDALEVIEQSRGRTPIVHWFNPNEELAMTLHEKPVRNFQAKKNQLTLEKDLSVLPLTWARRDDVVIVDQMPTREHLRNLKRWGFPVPEFILREDSKSLKERKIGGLCPWAWGPQSSRMMQTYQDSIPAKVNRPWREAVSPTLFSKLSGLQLAEKLDEKIGVWCTTSDAVVAAISNIPGGILLKAALSSAGRGHLKITQPLTDKDKNWIKNILKDQGGIAVEPWLDKVVDFSAQYEVYNDHIKLKGMTRVINDPSGHYLGTFVHSKWSTGLDSELTKFLYKEQQLMELYREKMPELIREIIDPNYRGNFGIDAMVYLDDHGNYQLRKIVEINPRITMGRVALELQKKSESGKVGYYEIIRKSKIKNFNQWLKNLTQSQFFDDPRLIGEGIYPINDPAQAKEFIALWHVRNPMKY